MNLSAEAWITFNQFPARYQKWPNNSYFVKIKTFSLQTDKLLGNMRKTHFLDLISNFLDLDFL